MISETRDLRRSFGRWFTACLIVAVASMIGIRTCSVRHRADDSHDARRGALQSADQFGGVSNDPSSAAESAHRSRAGEARAAFEHAVCAWNEIQIGGSDGGATVVGNVHNDARRGGEVRLEGDSDVYGRLTSRGTITIGSDEGIGSFIDSGDGAGLFGGSVGPTTVHGSVAGDAVFVNELGEVRDFLDLHEWAEGIDLNGDGDIDDLNVGLDVVQSGEAPALVSASRQIVCVGEEIPSGGTDTRIADGTRPVEVGAAPCAPAAYVYPDFRAYYEMASGGSLYPPESDHVASDIPGDGDAHYFASASVFLAWLNTHTQTDVLCWRCAGDGSIDPEDATVCPDCDGSGKVQAVEIAGVFYVDDETLDLGAIETHLVVHGTIVVAEGNPSRWPRRKIESPGSSAMTIEHFPDKGSLGIGGPRRMHFTQTYRSDRDGGPYVRRHRTIHNGDDEQTMCAAGPEEGRALRNFPVVVAASRVTVAPRADGFARHRGDIGDEAVTILQGTVFAGGAMRLGGLGGWKGDPLVFNEKDVRGEDDILDETVFRIDLNDDGDTFDRLRIADITGRPVIRVGKGRYHVDINGDGVLDKVAIGEDYGRFFAENGYALPVLVYHEGTLIGESIRIGAQCAVLFDRAVAGALWTRAVARHQGGQRELVSRSPQEVCGIWGESPAQRVLVLLPFQRHHQLRTLVYRLPDR